MRDYAVQCSSRSLAPDRHVSVTAAPLRLAQTLLLLCISH